jgi:hypothetical protein
MDAEAINLLDLLNAFIESVKAANVFCRNFAGCGDGRSESYHLI